MKGVLLLLLALSCYISYAEELIEYDETPGEKESELSTEGRYQYYEYDYSEKATTAAPTKPSTEQYEYDYSEEPTSTAPTKPSTEQYEYDYPEEPTSAAPTKPSTEQYVDEWLESNEESSTGTTTPKSTTKKPRRRPTKKPSRKPTEKPSRRPTKNPNRKPIKKPSRKPTEKPRRKPTENPNRKPTEKPRRKPTENPTRKPTEKPRRKPTEKPSNEPENEAARKPTKKPSRKPTEKPSNEPENEAARKPTKKPRQTTTTSKPIPSNEADLKCLEGAKYQKITPCKYTCSQLYVLWNGTAYVRSPITTKVKEPDDSPCGRKKVCQRGYCLTKKNVRKCRTHSRKRGNCMALCEFVSQAEWGTQEIFVNILNRDGIRCRRQHEGVRQLASVDGRCQRGICV